MAEYMRVVVATKNKGKMKEIRAILGACGIDAVSMEEAGFEDDVIEDGETFEENATKKAVAIANALGCPALADDSGLEIDFLGNQPGVRSKRFLGEDTPQTTKNEKILEMMKDTEEGRRGARFVCVMALAFPVGEGFNARETLIARGELEGVVCREPKGTGGFGYDPVFFLPSVGLTLAEMPEERKNAVSHRRVALDNMLRLLEGR